MKNILLQVYEREGFIDDMAFDWSIQQLSAASPLPHIHQSSMVEDPPIMSTLPRGTASISNPDGGLSSSVKMSNPSSSSLHALGGRDYINDGRQIDGRPNRHSLPPAYMLENKEAAKNENRKDRRKKRHCKPCSIM